jgi:hypothetical protein
MDQVDEDVRNTFSYAMDIVKTAAFRRPDSTADTIVRFSSS